MKCKCDKKANFGLPNQKPMWCSKCKPDDAIDVVHKKCPCGKRPNFGRPGGNPTWCGTCKDKPDDAVDVVSKK